MPYKVCRRRHVSTGIIPNLNLVVLRYFAESEKMFKAEVEAGGKHVASEVNRRRIIHRAKMKSVRISVVIVVAFIVCWTPYYIMMIIFMFLNPDEHVSNYR